MNIESIRGIVEKAREVLVENGSYIGKTFFDRFPNGACGCTTDMLSKYLISKGVRNIESVSGQRGESSHAWLEYENYIIDITGDQFTDGVSSVYISKNREFHDQFVSQTRVLHPLPHAIMSDSYNKFSKLMIKNA
ncbi:hypothetical protein [Shewanella phaeophyticola]|uniref:Microcin J25-processing protein McjB C-terminal domain-containing protein n=1 Tax=Shewanella phaeophyticola TaxID=2978345 RepID=A0ABT2P5J8_9GAMM|nr:hypothetical protein [Shewanella sp. KJ10-1]MCT8987169.1 hypothetical protein [Shewanella sp. KJ10-1]